MKQVKNLIIGFGKAGKTLAALFDKKGEEVLLVEQSTQMYGGTCINVGCIPSKKLIYDAKQHQFESAQQNKDRLIGALRQANFKKLEDLTNVQIVNAAASFVDDHTVQLSTGEMVRAERIFINTGATPIMPKVAGIEDERIFNSSEILATDNTQKTAPKRFVIIGAGFIALEFAFMYHAFGSQVTIIEKFDRFLPSVDEDVRECILNILKQKGIELHLGCELSQFESTDECVKVITDKAAFDADQVLVAIGRQPNTKQLNLHNTSVKLSERGYIVCDEKLKASEHIWAMGDVAGSPQFTYISLDDYRIVADTLFGHSERTTHDRQVFPTSVFIEPPLSHIGMTQNQAQKSGKSYKVLTLNANQIVKAKITGQTDGLLKAIIDEDTHQILGVTLFCQDSHEIINLFKLAMDHGIKADYFKNQIFTHPTVSESLNDLFAQV